MPSILVIDDEVILGRQISRALSAAGHEVQHAETGASGLALLHEHRPDLVLVDLRLPDTTGLEILTRLAQDEPELPVVLMTAYGSVGDAVEAMRNGAVDYLQKPLDMGELRLLVDRVLARQREARELLYLREQGGMPDPYFGDHPSFTMLFEQLRRLRDAELPAGRRPGVLITGETGTGKGVLAREVHRMLGGGPFLELNCTAMPESLMEAELFGHEKGAFTDARSARAGLFEAAGGGTIFLDEIGHASPGLQAKLLKVIEDKRLRRIGSTRDRDIDVHVIAATNRNLDDAVRDGEFREDLLHRLGVLRITVPPLRDRRSDIAPLAQRFCEEIGAIYRRSAKLNESALELLASHEWPGNVRELRNEIERALLLSADDEITESTVRALLVRGSGALDGASVTLPPEGIDLAQIERDLIRQALERTSGNRTHAAALLGLSRATLRYRLEKFGIE